MNTPGWSHNNFLTYQVDKDWKQYEQLTADNLWILGYLRHKEDSVKFNPNKAVFLFSNGTSKLTCYGIFSLEKWALRDVVPEKEHSYNLKYDHFLTLKATQPSLLTITFIFATVNMFWKKLNVLPITFFMSDVCFPITWSCYFSSLIHPSH